MLFYNDFMKNTSWEPIADWYKKIVGVTGHYYHKEVILPKVLEILNLKDNESVVDFACGQGILARVINSKSKYLGFDISKELINEAISHKNSNQKFVVADITKEMRFDDKFDFATIILAFQNLKNPRLALKNIYQSLKDQGKLVIVINHPCFRVPKHSDWIFQRNKQMRIIESYLSKLEIPIESSPFDKRNNQITWSFHYSLSEISKMLKAEGFLIESVEEHISPKKSEGGRAVAEDRARKEIPMFMTIVAVKANDKIKL